MPKEADQGPERRDDVGPGLRTIDKLVAVAPRDSDRLFVDIASYNTKVYFVLGDVNRPGRLPATGRETVLDAIQYAGGLDPNADPKSLRLVRPARGGKPAKVYPIDLEAIQVRGEARANLQIFPGDRLFIGRDATVEATMRLNRESAPLSTLVNNALAYAFILRNLDLVAAGGTARAGIEMNVRIGEQTLRVNLGDAASPTNPERRKAIIRALDDFWKQAVPPGNEKEERLRQQLKSLLDK